MPLLRVTRPSDLCWQISFDSAPDNRLTDDMFAQLASAMDQVEYEWRSQSQSSPVSSPSSYILLLRTFKLIRIG